MALFVGGWRRMSLSGGEFASRGVRNRAWCGMPPPTSRNLRVRRHSSRLDDKTSQASSTAKISLRISSRPTRRADQHGAKNHGATRARIGGSVSPIDAPMTRHLQRQQMRAERNSDISLRRQRNRAIQRDQASGLCGWRRSADRARLQPNSLLTGNFTGKFAILVAQRPVLRSENAAPQ